MTLRSSSFFLLHILFIIIVFVCDMYVCDMCVHELMCVYSGQSLTLEVSDAIHHEIQLRCISCNRTLDPRQHLTSSLCSIPYKEFCLNFVVFTFTLVSIQGFSLAVETEIKYFRIYRQLCQCSGSLRLFLPRSENKIQLYEKCIH